MRFQTISRQKKTFKVAHMDPGDIRLDYILLPVGYSYNASITEAKKGDILRLADGSTHEIVTVRRLKINKSETELLCRIRYGITLKGALVRWRMNARLEGHGEKAISDEECLWIIFKKTENE